MDFPFHSSLCWMEYWKTAYICYTFLVYIFLGEIVQSKIWTVADSFKENHSVRELESDFDRSYNPFFCLKNPRETQQILLKACCDVWQLLLSGISSTFQTYPSFYISNLILLNPTSRKIIPLFLSFLFWTWYYPVSFKPRM